MRAFATSESHEFTLSGWNFYRTSRASAPPGWCACSANRNEGRQPVDSPNDR